MDSPAAKPPAGSKGKEGGEGGGNAFEFIIQDGPGPSKKDMTRVRKQAMKAIGLQRRKKKGGYCGRRNLRQVPVFVNGDMGGDEGIEEDVAGQEQLEKSSSGFYDYGGGNGGGDGPDAGEDGTNMNMMLSNFETAQGMGCIWDMIQTAGPSPYSSVTAQDLMVVAGEGFGSPLIHDTTSGMQIYCTNAAVGTTTISPPTFFTTSCSYPESIPRQMPLSGLDKLVATHGVTPLDLSVLTTVHVGMVASSILAEEAGVLLPKLINGGEDEVNMSTAAPQKNILSHTATYLNFIPSRFGRSKCLDDAVAALLMKGEEVLRPSSGYGSGGKKSQETLRMYGRALRSLQAAVDKIGNGGNRIRGKEKEKGCDEGDGVGKDKDSTPKRNVRRSARVEQADGKKATRAEAESGNKRNGKEDEKNIDTETEVANVVAATEILALFELLNVSSSSPSSSTSTTNNSSSAWSLHVSGAGRLIQTLGPLKFRTDFERALVLGLCGPLAAEAVRKNTHCFLASDPAWALAMEKGRPVGDEIVFTSASFSRAAKLLGYRLLAMPGLVRDTSDAVCLAHRGRSWGAAAEPGPFTTKTVIPLIAKLLRYRDDLRQWRELFYQKFLEGRTTFFPVPPPNPTSPSCTPSSASSVGLSLNQYDTPSTSNSPTSLGDSSSSPSSTSTTTVDSSTSIPPIGPQVRHPHILSPPSPHYPLERVVQLYLSCLVLSAIGSRCLSALLPRGTLRTALEAEAQGFSRAAVDGSRHAGGVWVRAGFYLAQKASIAYSIVGSEGVWATTATAAPDDGNGDALHGDNTEGAQPALFNLEQALEEFLGSLEEQVLRSPPACAATDACPSDGSTATNSGTTTSRRYNPVVDVIEKWRWDSWCSLVPRDTCDGITCIHDDFLGVYN